MEGGPPYPAVDPLFLIQLLGEGRRVETQRSLCQRSTQRSAIYYPVRVRVRVCVRVRVRVREAGL